MSSTSLPSISFDNLTRAILTYPLHDFNIDPGAYILASLLIVMDPISVGLFQFCVAG